MRSALLAGLAYFAILFGAGTAAGLLRVLLVSPHLGAMGGVLIELPVMLILAWIVCGWLVDRQQIGERLACCVTMGGSALILLIAAETGLSLLLGGRAIEVMLNTADTWALALGFAAQAAACAFPLVRCAPLERRAGYHAQ